MAERDSAPLVVPMWVAQLLANPRPRKCVVCVSHRPWSKGHDENPPCIGYAMQVLQEALNEVDSKHPGD